MDTLEVDVLIIGGGACGLTCSSILSDLGVDHLLVERRAGTSHLPKAHYYNPRTMEIFRQHGIADRIYAAGMPLANCKVRYLTSLGGDGPLDARELYTFDGFGGGSLRAAAVRASAGPAVHLPQIALEPLLLDTARARAGERVAFQHEVVELEQDAEGVCATIRDHGQDRAYRVRARYAVASDGGRFSGPNLGIAMEGHRNLAVLVTAYIECDLSAHVPGDAIITHLIHPESRFRWGVFVPAGPTWGKKTENWAFTFAYHFGDDDRLTEDDIVPAIRESMRLPDIPITLHRVSAWTAEATVADRFQDGRIFLAGDAAHKVVPTAGLGLNSAIQDAHNLAWKLAAVVKGDAGEGLLDSYAVERRQASLRNAHWSLFTFQNHLMVDVGLGLFPGQSAEQNVAAVSAYLSDTPMGRTLRARAKEIVGTQRAEYGSLEVELGGHYDSDAAVADGSPVPESDPMGDHHVATTRPGHRLPHAWLAWPTERRSTHDLTGASSAFALITGSEGQAWRDAAVTAARTLGIEIKVVSVGLGGDCRDATGQWDAVKAIGEDGAILVRPDNVVGFRAKGAVERPAQALTDALRLILGTKEGGVGSAGPVAKQAELVA